MKNYTIKFLLTSIILTASIFAFSQHHMREHSVGQEPVNKNYKAPAFTVKNSIFTEDFSSGVFPPVGWTIQGEGQENWDESATNYAGGIQPEAKIYYYPTFIGVSRLVTSQIATSGYSELIFEMKHFLNDYSGGYTLRIETTSDGNTWNEIWSEFIEGGFDPEVLQLTIDNENVGSDNFQLAFTFDGESNSLNDWYIDDIALSESISYDAAVISIDIPVLMTTGNVCEPGAVVKNKGLETVSFNVTFEILDDGIPAYSEEYMVSDLGSFESESITFPSWISIAGNFEAKVTASLTNDENPENDSMSKVIDVIEGIYEDFESVIAPEIPEDWYKIVISNSPYANVRSFTNQGVDDSQCVKMVNVSDLDADLLFITPPLIGGAANKYLHFYSWSYGSQLSVGTITDPTDISTYTELEVLDINNVNIMEEYEVYFSEYTGTDEYIAFKGIYDNTFGDIALDNIMIEELQSCTSPSDLNASETTQTSAILEWVENGEATQWRIEYGEMGFTPSGNAMIYTDENPYLLEGLDPGTYYDFYVQADCGVGSISDWVGPYYFATLCNASASIPYIEGFEEVVLPFMPPCNVVENSNDDEWQWISSDTNPYSGENHAVIEPTNAIQMDDWFFSPGLELEGGETYIVNFYYTSNSDSDSENLEVKFGTEANAASMISEPIFEDMMFAYNNIYQLVNASFLPDEDGTYYIGWHGFSNPGNWSIYIDDIYIDMKVDSLELEAPSNLTGPTEVQYNEDINLSWEAPSTPSASFFEGFEGDFLPEGWSKFNLDGGSGWQALEVGTSPIPGWIDGTATACPNGGLQQAFATWLTAGSPVSDQWLVTPQLTYSEGDTLGFWMGIYRDDYSEHIEVLISTTIPDDPEAFNIVVDIIDLPSGTPIGWTYYSYDLTNIVPDGTPIYIAFRENVANNSNEGNATSLDNISLSKTESKYFDTQLYGYNIYHKFNSGVFEKVGYTNNTTYTHVSPDIGAHSYYVTSVFSNGESGPSNEHTVDVLTSISKQLFGTTQVYPNPANDIVNIESEYTIESVTVYNFAGQIVLTKIANSAKYSVNTSDLEAGIYLFQIETKEGRIAKRIIVE